MRHVSTTPVQLPAAGVDPAVDAAVLAGRYKDLKLVTLPGRGRDMFGRPVGTGEQLRIGRTKGVSFRYPDRPAARAAALASSRAARKS